MNSCLNVRWKRQMSASIAQSILSIFIPLTVEPIGIGQSFDQSTSFPRFGSESTGNGGRA